MGQDVKVLKGDVGKMVKGDASGATVSPSVSASPISEVADVSVDKIIEKVTGSDKVIDLDNSQEDKKDENSAAEKEL